MILAMSSKGREEAKEISFFASRNQITVDSDQIYCSTKREELHKMA